MTSCTCDHYLPALCGECQARVDSNPPLCAECASAAQEWATFQSPLLTGGVRLGGGGGADETPRGVLERQKARADHWWATVRWQCDLIRRICAVKHEDRRV